MFHQLRQNAVTASEYRRECDLYSFGILLLEIGFKFWVPARRIFDECKTDADKVKKKNVPEPRGRMGKAYSDIASACLEGSFGRVMGSGGETQMESSFLLDSDRLAISVLDKNLLGLGT